MKTVLVTGAAGFIGSHVVDRLLTDGLRVVGVDNFSNNYDPKIKEENIKDASHSRNFILIREDILNSRVLSKIFKENKINLVIHLAAKTGVRPSITNPQDYARVNVLGTINLLKLAASMNILKFIFGSSSSVYGESKTLPFSEGDSCERIISPYGASKRSAEFFVEVFAKTTDLQCLILRFFTVLGPRGRPDMAPALFTKAIEAGEPIKQFGDGTSSRDYTFIDDVVDGIIKSLSLDLKFKIINLGNSKPVILTDFIKTCEKLLAKKAKIIRLPKVMGDAEKTWAEIRVAQQLLGWQPKTSLDEGLVSYIKWQRAGN